MAIPSRVQRQGLCQLPPLPDTLPLAMGLTCRNSELPEIGPDALPPAPVLGPQGQKTGLQAPALRKINRQDGNNGDAIGAPFSARPRRPVRGVCPPAMRTSGDPFADLPASVASRLRGARAGGIAGRHHYRTEAVRYAARGVSFDIQTKARTIATPWLASLLDCHLDALDRSGSGRVVSVRLDYSHPDPAALVSTLQSHQAWLRRNFPGGPQQRPGYRVKLEEGGIAGKRHAHVVYVLDGDVSLFGSGFIRRAAADWASRVGSAGYLHIPDHAAQRITSANELGEALYRASYMAKADTSAELRRCWSGSQNLAGELEGRHSGGFSGYLGRTLDGLEREAAAHASKAALRDAKAKPDQLPPLPGDALPPLVEESAQPARNTHELPCSLPPLARFPGSPRYGHHPVHDRGRSELPGLPGSRLPHPDAYASANALPPVEAYACADGLPHPDAYAGAQAFPPAEACRAGRAWSAPDGRGGPPGAGKGTLSGCRSPQDAPQAGAVYDR